ncbi:MAG: ABC transporter ATP-binding protein [Chloroflexota bacterium]
MSVIEVKNLTKVYRIAERPAGAGAALRAMFRPTYRNVVAVDTISFTVEPGEIIGYIGPNGAGKSSTIKMLTGILVPTDGAVTVNGLVPHRNRQENARHIGLVFGQRTQLWWDLPVRESFYMLKKLYGIPETTYRDNVELFHDLLGLGDIWDVPVRQLSLGQRVRADIAAAMVHSPDTVFLDEPTIGLDVMVKERIREFLRRINAERKTTIILTTHDLRDIEATCPRVIMIHKGRIIFDDGLAALRGVFGDRSTLTVLTAGPYDAARVPSQLTLVREEAGKLWLEFDRSRVTASDAVQMACATLPVADITLQETDLESVVKRVYGGEAV